jgi:small subunit ribosomal protein S10
MPYNVIRNNVIRIFLRGYDYALLDRSVFDIVETAKAQGANVVGPIPLPTEISRYTVIRSPHIFKHSREQFESKVHKRLVFICECSPSVIESMMSLSLSSGVDVKIRLDDSKRGKQGTQSAR